MKTQAMLGGKTHARGLSGYDPVLPCDSPYPTRGPRMDATPGPLVFLALSARSSWLWVKNRYPKWNLGKWKHGLKSADPWWCNIDPQPGWQSAN